MQTTQNKKMKSPSAVRKTQKDMRLYRRQLMGLMSDVSKDAIESILSSYLMHTCAGRRHAMANKMQFIRKAAIDIKPDGSMSPSAIRKALDKRVAELETENWTLRGIVETYSPKQKQIASHMIESFSAKGGMRCT